MGIGGAIMGGISASKAMKAVKKNIKNQLKDNENWYDRRYNEDATQRADAQRILTLTEENIKNRNRQAAGAAAVAGGTDESVAAAKALGNQAVADATAQIAAAGEARKDNIEAQYRNRKDELNEALNNAEMGRAQAVSQAIGGVSQAAGNLGKLF